jgi:hypothetical protein
MEFGSAQMHIFRYNGVAIVNIRGPLASITTLPSQQISLWSYSLDVVVELILHSVDRASSFSIHPCHLLYHSLVGSSSVSCMYKTKLESSHDQAVPPACIIPFNHDYSPVPLPAANQPHAKSAIHINGDTLLLGWPENTPRDVGFFSSTPSKWCALSDRPVVDPSRRGPQVFPSSELLQLQWKLLRVAAVCRAADITDKDDCDVDDIHMKAPPWPLRRRRGPPPKLDDPPGTATSEPPRRSSDTNNNSSICLLPVGGTAAGQVSNAATDTRAVPHVEQ